LAGDLFGFEFLQEVHKGTTDFVVLRDASRRV
jgi:hypothetical protein